MSLSRRDEAVLLAWWRQAWQRRGVLPDGLAPVHSRLVRAVGTGLLPDAGPVHVKIMTFPRGKDRLRYLLRALPAEHEARLLAAAAAAGVAVPEVVWVRAARCAALPRLCMLATRTLLTSGTPEPAAIARTAAALAAAGFAHPDLHAGNFLRLADGRTAVVDLQSARRRRAPLSRRARQEMSARLLAGTPSCDAALLVAHGLLDGGDAAAAQARARALGRRALLRRIRRCLGTSSEFVAERHLTGTLHRRRGTAPGTATRGDASLVRLWLGDRALEILNAEPPRLAALFRRYWWLPGRHSVYSRVDRHVDPERDARLLEGFARFAALRRARRGP